MRYIIIKVLDIRQVMRVKGTNEQVEQDKDRVIQCASAMFHMRGIKDVKMDEIASSLSMSKRTIYELFKDKETLLLDCMEYHHVQKRKEAELIVKNSSNVLEVILLVYAHSLKKLHSTNLKFFQDIKQYPRAAAEIDRRNNEDLEAAVSFFRQGIEQGIFRSDINFEIFTEILHQQIDSLLHEGFDTRFSFFDVYEFIMFTFFRGVSTRKGQDIIEDFISKYKREDYIEE